MAQNDDLFHAVGGGHADPPPLADLVGDMLDEHIRRQYKKTIKKAGKYQPTGAETPAELEERNELSGDGMRWLHDGYEKARYSCEGCTKEEAEALRN